MAHQIDVLIAAAANVGAVDIQGKAKAAYRPGRNGIAYGPRAVIKARIFVVAAVVPGAAVLALFALLYAIDVDHGNGHDFHVGTKPGTIFRIPQKGGERTLKYIARHRLAGVMAGREEDTMFWWPILGPDAYTGDGAVSFTLAQAIDP